MAVVIVMIVRALTRRRDDLRLSQEEEMRFRRLLDALDKMERRIDKPGNDPDAAPAPG